VRQSIRSPSISPASFLSNSKRLNLTILSGPRGTGKTTWCQRLLQRAHQEGRRARGLISPAVWVAGDKTAIDLLDVSSGERQRLASRRDLVDCASGEGPVTSDWRFHSQALEWGNRVLEQALAEGLRGDELLLLDELGSLELEQGQGLQTGLALLDTWVQIGPAGGRAWVVVRPSLLQVALARWPVGEVVSLIAGDEA
jgi:nucleoside-triphosphatase